MIYKADRQAADRALNAACKKAATIIRWGHDEDRATEARFHAVLVLSSAVNTVALLIDEEA